jgi:hypothetical protein
MQELSSRAVPPSREIPPATTRTAPYWVGVAGCLEGSPEDVGQSLVMTEEYRYDALTFHCSGERGVVYFDFSADPVEQALEDAIRR